MKREIHPEYVECRVTCSCGNSFTTRSTRSEIKADLCSSCHPFFTGKQKLVDSAGRVEKFRRRYGLRHQAEKPSTEDSEPEAQQPEGTSAQESSPEARPEE